MKKVIITGTSRGIGFELAQQFAKNNFQVLALSRNKKPLDDLQLKNITTLSVDVCKQEDIEKVSNFIQKNWKGFLLNLFFISFLYHSCSEMGEGLRSICKTDKSIFMYYMSLYFN